MSGPTRHTLGNLLSVLVVLAAGLFVVALATRGLVHTPASEAMVGITTVDLPQAQPITRPAPPQGKAPPDLSAPPAEKAHVRVIIDYGDGVQKHFTAIPHKEAMTAFDALLVAKAHARGIKLEHTGSGETALISAIDDLKNQGSGRDKKNWQFFLNDRFATTGAGATRLKPGDAVRWTFDLWQGK